MSKSSEYWGNRLQEITINRYEATIPETEKKLKRLYQSAMKKMVLETENTYIKLLETGKVTRSDLYQNSRYLALQEQFEIELAKLGVKEEKILSILFAEEYEKTFNLTREEMGEYKPQCVYNPVLANTIINQSWSGDNYSGRIWNNKDKLCTLLKDKTLEAILLGKSVDSVTKVVMDKFGAGYSDAERLVRSELMHTLNAAQQEVYKEAGYKELEILVYFDERTCDTCAKLDGTKLPIDSKDIPPIHARCRCTVIPCVESIKEFEFRNNGDIINSGSTYGALDSASERAQEHAERYYEAVRRMNTDIEKISNATGWKYEAIEKIKKHIFTTKHDLGNGCLEEFYPSYNMAQSWQRLISGQYRNIDIVLLKHEYLELNLMRHGYSQNEAHIVASKKHDYAIMVKRGE